MGGELFFGIADGLVDRRGREHSRESLRSARCGLCPSRRRCGRDDPDWPPEGGPRFYALGPPGYKALAGDIEELLPSGGNMDDFAFWAIARDGGLDDKGVAIDCCRGWIEDDIAEADPEAILLNGPQAFRWATGSGRLDKWAGIWLPVRIGGAVRWALPIHATWTGEEIPSAIRRGHLRRLLDGPPGRPPDPPTLDALAATVDPASGLQGLAGLLARADTLAFDLETSSGEPVEDDRHLRPYGRDARILCAAFSDGAESVVVPGDDLADAAWMIDGWRGRLIAHNAAFDMEWLFHFHPKFRDCRGVRWGCTQAMAYILHEKAGGNSLDELCAVALALPGLKAASSLDRGDLGSVGWSALASYCGMDAAACLALASVLEGMLERGGFMDVYRDQEERLLPAVMSQLRGFHVLPEPARALAAELRDGMDGIEARIRSDPDVRAYGGFDISSEAWLKGFIERGLGAGRTLGSADTKRGWTLDKQTLEAVGHPALGDIIEWREAGNMLSTYVSGVVPGGKHDWGGVVHPQYNMSRVSTRRSSASNPNIQNQPKRNDWAKAVRALYAAPEGSVLVSMDYGQMEARVVAMASRDRKLSRMIADRYDIHADWGRRILEEFPGVSPMGAAAADDPEEFGRVRQTAKGFVFGNLFGQSENTCREYLGCPKGAARRLYHDFWEVFPGVRAWHRKVIDDYERLGYVLLLDGFMRRAPIAYSQIINTPIQGSAFGIVMDCWRRLVDEALREDDPHLIPPVQIHDDLTFVVPEAEADAYIDRIVDIAFDWDDERLPWINVPLSVEVSIGRSWDRMETVGEFHSDD